MPHQIGNTKKETEVIKKKSNTISGAKKYNN